ncbi:MAG: hypothetical protein ABR537_01350 [Gemmatimonadales bacterium]
MMLTALALPLALLGMQEGIAERLDGRVPPDLAALVTQIGSAAAARGLPVDPLIQKAIEGSAKGIPTDRVGVAVRVVAAQLDSAAAALREAGLAPDTLAIAAGGFAISAGLNGRDVAQLAKSGAALPALVTGLRVAGTLAALGVPETENVALVRATLHSGRATAELLALPRQVQAEIAKGTAPAQAAEGLARAAAAQSRHGPPPGHEHPAHPQRSPHP